MNIRHFQKINTNAELKSKICNMILISYNNDGRQIKRSNSCIKICTYSKKAY